MGGEEEAVRSSKWSLQYRTSSNMPKRSPFFRWVSQVVHLEPI
jgi:hypothetical protein